MSDLYSRDGRVPTDVMTRANAHVTNGAGYAQESVSLCRNRLVLGGGIRLMNSGTTLPIGSPRTEWSAVGRALAGKGQRRFHAHALRPAHSISELRTRDQQHRRARCRSAPGSAQARHDRLLPIRDIFEYREILVQRGCISD